MRAEQYRLAEILLYLEPRAAFLRHISPLKVLYSCFEKGCPTKPHSTMPKGIMGNGGLWYLIEALGVSAT